VADAHAVRDYLRFVGGVVRRWVSLEQPTIAAVNGPALGGGCNLALACDRVLMREDATIGQVYASRGLFLAWAAPYFLPRLFGRARAFELAYYGRALTAAGAAAIGLVNRAVPAADWDETVRAWAEGLARGASRALAMIKAGLLAAPLLDLDAALEWEANAIALAFRTADVEEAFSAFREQRPARLTGR